MVFSPLLSPSVVWILHSLGDSSPAFSSQRSAVNHREWYCDICCLGSSPLMKFPCSLFSATSLICVPLLFWTNRHKTCHRLCSEGSIIFVPFIYYETNALFIVVAPQIHYIKSVVKQFLWLKEKPCSFQHFAVLLEVTEYSQWGRKEVFDTTVGLLARKCYIVLTKRKLWDWLSQLKSWNIITNDMQHYPVSLKTALCLFTLVCVKEKMLSISSVVLMDSSS